MIRYLTLRQTAEKLGINYTSMKRIWPKLAAAGLPVYELPGTRWDTHLKAHKRIREDELDAVMKQFQVVQDYRGVATPNTRPSGRSSQAFSAVATGDPSAV